MSPRPNLSEVRKDQILDAASEVFAKKGIHEARMDDVVEKSGLSKGSLYWYFKSKDEIVIGIFERLFSRELVDLEQLVSEQSSAADRLIKYADRILRDVFRLLPFAPIAYEFLSLAFRRNYFREAFKIYLNDHLEILVPIIQQGVDSGEFRRIDANDTAIAISAIFEGTLLLWVYDSRVVKPEKHIISGIELLIAGMQA